MPYTTTTLVQLRNQLLDRLQDNGIFPGTSAATFWTATELNALIVEALRTWQALTGYYRQRVSFPSVQGQAFYDLSIPGQVAGGVMDYNYTLNDAVTSIQARLLEALQQTDQFTQAGIVAALNRRRDRFLGDTGSVVTHVTQFVSPPPIGRITLDEKVMDVRRAAWCA